MSVRFLSSSHVLLSVHFPSFTHSISPLVTPLHSFLVPFRAGGGWSGEGHVENRARQTLNGTGRDVE